MGFFEIVILVLGGAFLIISFFVGNETKSEEKNSTENMGPFVFPQEELDNAEKKIMEQITTASDNALTNAENRLSTMSNETIMYVDDFSKQTLERIQHNHDEVVFMYNMLQTKEEELKKTEAKILHERDNLEQQKNELESLMTPKISGESGIEVARRKSAGEKSETEKKKTAKKAEPKVVVREAAASAPEVNEFTDAGEEGKTQKILELYRQKKSVLEISKQLGLGQGEVKLVIDLYGRG